MKSEKLKEWLIWTSLTELFFLKSHQLFKIVCTFASLDNCSVLSSTSFNFFPLSHASIFALKISLSPLILLAWNKEMTILYDKINFHLIFVAKTWNPECSGMIKGSIKEGWYFIGIHYRGQGYPKDLMYSRRFWKGSIEEGWPL